MQSLFLSVIIVIVGHHDLVVFHADGNIRMNVHLKRTLGAGGLEGSTAVFNLDAGRNGIGFFPIRLI